MLTPPPFRVNYTTAILPVPFIEVHIDVPLEVSGDMGPEFSRGLPEKELSRSLPALVEYSLWNTRDP